MAILLDAGGAWALDPAKAITQYNHETWLARDGLPQNSVWSIVQTRDGYLWLGTEEGVARFDGVRFTVFDKKNTPEIRQNYVLHMIEARDGSLWFGTGGGGATRFVDGRFTTIGLAEGLSSNSARCLHEDADGGLWIGTLGGGLNHLEDGTITTYRAGDGLGSDFVRSIVPDGTGGLWLATNGGGLVRLRDGRFEALTTRDGLASDNVMTLYRDRDDNLWIGTLGGMSCYREGRLASFYQRDGLPDEAIYAFLHDRDGNLWIGTEGGLCRYRNGKFEVFSVADGLSGNRIRSLFEDREGSLWVGTFGYGLNRLQNGKFTIWSAKEGLAQDAAGPVYQDRSGDIWVGTLGSGVSRFRGGRFTTFTSADGIGNNFVDAICQDREGSLWFGTFGGGVTRLKNGSMRTFGAAEGLKELAVMTIFEDRSGNLWMGTNGGGLHLFRDGRFTRYTTKDGLINDSVRVISEDRDGGLWIGTFGAGLSILKDGRFTSYSSRNGLSRDGIRPMVQDEDGVIWIGTLGGGINRFKDGRFTAVTFKEGLFDDNVYSITADDLGYFWMTCNNGIFKVLRSELNDCADGRMARVHSIAYGEADGMRNRECNASFPAALKARDGKLWFPTLGGVVVVDPDSIPGNRLPPPIVIEQVLADGKLLSPGSGFRVPPGKGNLEVHYTGLSFLAPQMVKFKYRLKGYDEEWIDADTRRVAYYTNLPPGGYEFQVSGCNNDGVWNDRGASLAFRLEPHFYQTWWFVGLSGLAAVLTFLGWHKRRVFNLKKRARELQGLVDERTKAEEALRGSNARLEEAMSDLQKAQDGMIEQERLRALGQMASGITHDFNNALSPILGYTDLMLARPQILEDPGRTSNYLKTINTAARDAVSVVGRLREFYRPRDEEETFPLVQLNPIVEQAVTLSQPRWKGQAQSLGLTIDVHTELEPGLPSVPGNEADLREMLTNLIFNAVDAMSRGGTLSLATRIDGGSAVIEVRDTGCGMSEEVRRRCLEPFFTTKGDQGTGLGLPMVYGIIRRHRGTLSIDSQPSRGTTFIIRLPIDAARKPDRLAADPGGRCDPLDILLIDDEPKVLRVVTEFLAVDGHRVETAADGIEGLERFRSLPFDCVITDRAMPRMNGDQVAQAVRRLRPDLPVIMLTGFGELMRAREERVAGVDLVLPKPVTLASLRRGLTRVMPRKTRPDAPGGLAPGPEDGADPLAA